jgi:circadian clock protein KaiC
MAKQQPHTPAPSIEIPKSPTGIRGLDEITRGGLPLGRPTLVCGGPGSGKTLFGIEFLVRGILDYDEPGVFITFEERPADLIANTGSLGFDLDKLVSSRKLFIDQVVVEATEIIETGEYNLDGLFIRLAAAINLVHAKRVVIDTIEVLFAALPNMGILRSELHRLFLWLKSQGVTTIVTGERGGAALTRNSLEEYVSDCVIVLDQRMFDQIATRRLRVVKYRGSLHGTNEYPFLIDQQGLFILPITSIALDHTADKTFVSTGIPTLDEMLNGKGYYCGGTLMVSGGAGTGKSSIASHFVDAACRRGERCVYFAFEESPAQLARNMRSIGIDLAQWEKAGLLRIVARRPSTFGLEVHISMMAKSIEEFQPRIVVLDPISSFVSAGTAVDAHAMLMRMTDLLKSRHISSFLTCLTRNTNPEDESTIGISSLVDTWLSVRNLELQGLRSRTLMILKSRGMKHSNQVREMLITDHGVSLVEGPGGARLYRERQAETHEAVGY